MEKEFNVTGSCHPRFHYMVDISAKLAQIREMIEKGRYFNISRPRQFGKSTCLEAVEQDLEPRGHTVLPLTFESMTDTDFRDEKSFAREFTRQLARNYKRKNRQAPVDFIETYKPIETFGQLDDFITGLVELEDKPTVLMVDEVDQGSNNQMFLHFLALLRSKYLTRHKYATFHSVILAGVYDVKTLKLKIPSADETKYNSPWNIAADFNVDMTFLPHEIATMLSDYAGHKKSKWSRGEVEQLSERLYYYSAGHPFLVSRLCKTVDEDIHPQEKTVRWSVADIDDAFRRLVSDGYTTTNFDEMIKNLENNPQLHDLVFKIIMDGEKVSFNVGNPVIELGYLLGILAGSADGTVIHNRVYQQRILNYMSSKIETSTGMDGFNFRDYFISGDNVLDLEKVLLKFQEFMKAQHSRGNKAFLEKDGRLVFLAFIRPIINGRGFDFKEVQVSEEKRLDIVITYMNALYTLELKKWYGGRYHEKGLRQFADYLDRQNQQRGYLIIFDFRARKKQWKQERIKVEDKEIFAVWV